MSQTQPKIGALYRCHPKFQGCQDVNGIFEGDVVLLIGWEHISKHTSQAAFLHGEKKVFVCYGSYAKGFRLEFEEIVSL